MNREELERYLHRHIPLSRAMAVAVREATPSGVILSAPLAPNINHRESVFGGSASAVAILAAWALLYLRLNEENIRSRLVIQRNTMQYEQPILGDFTAHSTIRDPAAWALFVKTFARRNRARISVATTLECAGAKVGELEGDFVALPPSGP